MQGLERMDSFRSFIASWAASVFIVGNELPEWSNPQLEVMKEFETWLYHAPALAEAK